MTGVLSSGLDGGVLRRCGGVSFTAHPALQELEWPDQEMFPGPALGDWGQGFPQKRNYPRHGRKSKDPGGLPSRSDLGPFPGQAGLDPFATC